MPVRLRRGQTVLRLETISPPPIQTSAGLARIQAASFAFASPRAGAYWLSPRSVTLVRGDGRREQARVVDVTGRAIVAMIVTSIAVPALCIAAQRKWRRMS